MCKEREKGLRELKYTFTANAGQVIPGELELQDGKKDDGFK
jgi:hypothetical protein